MKVSDTSEHKPAQAFANKNQNFVKIDDSKYLSLSIKSAKKNNKGASVAPKK